MAANSLSLLYIVGMSQADSQSQTVPRALISIGGAWRIFIETKYSELLGDDVCKPRLPGGDYVNRRNPKTRALAGC
jgi:hypothetical protein